MPKNDDAKEIKLMNPQLGQLDSEMCDIQR